MIEELVYFEDSLNSGNNPEKSIRDRKEAT